MKRTKLFLIVLLMALPLIFTACGSGAAPSAEQESTQSEAVEEAASSEEVEEVSEAVEEAASSEEAGAVTPRVDLEIVDLGQPETNPWVINRHRFEGCVADALSINLIEADDENSEEKHVSQAESLIARQPDGIVFNPLTSAAGIQVARLLEDNQIPGVAVGRLVVSDYDTDYDGEHLIAQVTQNNTTWGEAIAQAAIDAGHKKVAMIWNQKGVTSAEEIWAGAQSVFDQHPDVEIIAESWDRLNRENGILYAEQYIARFVPGEIDAIVVLGAVAGLGSQFAAEQAGRDDIAIITTDIDEQVAQFIADGKLGFSIGGHWMVGGFGLIQLYDYLHGFPVEDTQPLFSLIPVTQENVDIYANGLLQGCILSPEQIRSLSRVHNPDADLPGYIDNFSKNWEDFVAVEEAASSEEMEEVTPRVDLEIVDLGQPETNPWVINRHRFERCVAEALSINLIEADDENSEEKHVSQAESLIARQPDGIVFNPLTSAAGIQVARLLEDNQIPGVAVGRLVVSDYDTDYDGEHLIAQVTQNNTTWGEAIAQAAIDAGHKKVAMIWNQKGVTSAEEIWAGAQSVFDQHDDVEIIAESWDRLNRENGILYAEQYIARFVPGEIDAIVVLGAVAGLGSQFAAEQAGRDDIAIITTDIDEQVAQFIADGKLGFSIGGHWMVGGFGLIQLYDYLHGFPVEDTQPLFSLIPVTQENVDVYANGLLNGCILSPEQIRSLSRVHNPDADLPGYIDNFSKNWEDFVQ